jgi:hypothetical protein
MKSRSSADNAKPDTPVMNARAAMARIRPRSGRGSRKRPLIPLDG